MRLYFPNNSGSEATEGGVYLWGEVKFGPDKSGSEKGRCSDVVGPRLTEFLNWKVFEGLFSDRSAKLNAKRSCQVTRMRPGGHKIKSQVSEMASHQLISSHGCALFCIHNVEKKISLLAIARSQISCRKLDF